MQSFAARKRIDPLQARLMEVVWTIRGYYNEEYTFIMKEGFGEGLTGQFDEDAGRWALKLRDFRYRMRRLTMPYLRPYEASPVPMPGFKHTARWLVVAELQLVGVSGRNT